MALPLENEMKIGEIRGMFSPAGRPRDGDTCWLIVEWVNSQPELSDGVVDELLLRKLLKKIKFLQVGY